jgi:predicted RNase H-like nuclease
MQPPRQLPSPRMTRICGVDGCKYGWFSLICAENFSNVEWRVARNWTDLGLDATVIAVDMPIGLAAGGKRGCDEAARKAPQMRPSSIFPMPVRPALDFASYAQANAWSKANSHGGIVKQAWNLKPKILDVEAAVLATPGAPIYEAHPELTFARLADGPLASKKTPQGRAQRLSILARAGIDGLDAILAKVPRGHAAPDDILDAAILLVTAQRILRGQATVYPPSPTANDQGLKMQIWV